MSKIDASELIRQLEVQLEFSKGRLKFHEDSADEAQGEIMEYEHLLSLVKYEEEEVGVSDFVPPKHISDKSVIRPEYINAYLNEDGSVDWSVVPKGTLVEVSDSGEEWLVRQFNKYIPDDKFYRYSAFEGYNNMCVSWLRCRLYEGDIK